MPLGYDASHTSVTNRSVAHWAVMYTSSSFRTVDVPLPTSLLSNMITSTCHFSISESVGFVTSANGFTSSNRSFRPLICSGPLGNNHSLNSFK